MEDIKNRIADIKDVVRQKAELYAILDEMGVKYKKTRCIKCLKDLLNIAKEEAGMIGSAAEASDFNLSSRKWKYVKNNPVLWRGFIFDDNTPEEMVEKFVRYHNGYYVLNDKNE